MIYTYFVLIFGSALLFVTVKYMRVRVEVVAIAYILLISLLAAIRSEAFPDTVSYIDLYEKINLSSLYSLKSGYMEYGYILFTFIIKKIFGSDHRIYFFIISVLNYVIMYISIRSIYSSLNKNSFNINNIRKSEFYALVLYTLTYGFSYNFITLRAGLALSFSMCAISQLRKNKKISLILFIIGCMFHNSIIILIVVVPFFIGQVKIKRSVTSFWLVVLPPALFIGYSNILINVFFWVVDRVPFLAERFHAYINQNTIIVDQKGTLVRIILLIVLGMILEVGYSKNKYYDGLLVMYLLGITGYVFFVNIAIIGRVVELFLTSMVILLPMKEYVDNRPYVKYRLLEYIYVYFVLAYFSISNVRLIS